MKRYVNLIPLIAAFLHMHCLHVIGAFVYNKETYPSRYSQFKNIGKANSLSSSANRMQFHNELKKSSATELALDFGGLENFFNLNNKLNRKKIAEDPEIDENNAVEDDEDYPGCTSIFKIHVKSLKVGGCRLYLSLFFMGESNNPTKGSWKMNQNGDGGIDMYYKDTTGALIIEFREDAIVVKRLGSKPSMEYLMQESNMLTGMLDQLDEIAMDTSIEESDRLICIDNDAINVVRESLSFT